MVLMSAGSGGKYGRFHPPEARAVFWLILQTGDRKEDLDETGTDWDKTQ